MAAGPGATATNWICPNRPFVSRSRDRRPGQPVAVLPLGDWGVSTGLGALAQTVSMSP